MKRIWVPECKLDDVLHTLKQIIEETVLWLLEIGSMNGNMRVHGAR